MKNLKELQPILTAVYCINRTNGQEDEDKIGRAHV